MDAESPGSKGTAEKYGVTGYPTLKFFPKSSTSPVPYEGGRSESDILNFINTHAGTFRVPGGGLNDQAGRIASLDEIAHKYKGDATTLPALISEVGLASKALETPSSHAAYYAKVLEKLLKDPTYAEKELARLERVRTKGTNAQEKLDNMTIRQNILRQFLGEDVGQDQTPGKDEL